jgi:hypothetical protein
VAGRGFLENRALRDRQRLGHGDPQYTRLPHAVRELKSELISEKRDHAVRLYSRFSSIEMNPEASVWIVGDPSIISLGPPPDLSSASAETLNERRYDGANALT